MKTALFIIDHVPSPDFDATVIERFQARLGLTVQTKSSDIAVGKDAIDKDLILICSRTVSPELRSARTPIVVCQKEALYDLGMTLATPDVDFGTAMGVTNVNVKSAGHPFNLGISGLQQVVLGGTGIAWAKPNTDAVIAATIPGTVDKAVLFGYEIGAKMAALAAPSRRVGVLLLGTAASTLTETGWLLFDSAIMWALYGGPSIPQSVPTEGGFWYIEGKPTRVLSIEEYRGWVEDKVIRRMWAIISIIGVAGIIAIGSIAYAAIGNLVKANVKAELDTSIDKRVGSHLAEILIDKVQIRSQLDEHAREAVAASMDKAKIDELTRQAIEKLATPEVLAKLAANAVTSELKPQRIQELVQRAFDDPKENEKLVAAAVKQLTETEQFNTIMTGQLLPIVDDVKQELSEREQALRFLLLFDRDQDELRSELLKVITNADEASRDLCSIALISFSPSKDPLQDKNAIKTVLKKIGDSENKDEPLKKSYIHFFSRFPSKCALFLTAWLRSTDDADGQTLVVDALTGMQGDEPILQLAELSGDKNKRLRTLAFDALSQLDPNRGIDETGRRRAVEKVWSVIVESLHNKEEDESGFLQLYLKRVVSERKADDMQGLRELLTSEDAPDALKSWNVKFIAALDTSDTEELSRLTHIYGMAEFANYIGRDAQNKPQQQKIRGFAKLLRDTDLPILVGAPFWPQNSAESLEDRTAVEALVSAWVLSAKGATLTPNKSAKLADDLIDKILTLKSCLYSQPLADALRFGVAYCSADHCGLLISRFLDLYRDRPAEDKAARFVGGDALLESLKRDATANDKLAATRAFLDASMTQLKTLTDIAAGGDENAVGSTNKEIVYKKNQVDEIRRAWSELFVNVPDDPSVVDLTESRLQELKTADFLYTYKSLAPVVAKTYASLANTSYRDKAWSDAIRLYTKGIVLYAQDSESYKNRGLAYLEIGDEGHAEADMRMAIDLIQKQGASPTLIAGSMENLGLIYIRKKDWKAAYENTEEVRKVNDKTAWNWVIRAIAADSLGLSDEAKTARDKLALSESSLDEEMLSSLLPAEFGSYIAEASNIKARSR
jgi:tetratricopeptide (TPR) repeat protein